MAYPTLSQRASTRIVTDVFAGYNNNLKIADGEFYETKNLTTKYYPLLANRPKRGSLGPTGPDYDSTKTYAVGAYCKHDSKIYRCTTEISTAEAWTAAHWTEVSTFSNLQAIIAKDALYWVDNGTLYANGLATALTGLQTQYETRLISMGAYICVFPDKKYINTMDLTEYGSMEAAYSYSGDVTFHMCHEDGTIYEGVITSDNVPEELSNGQVWIDTSSNEVKQYSSYTASWITIETVYTRVEFTTNGQIPASFKEYDGVNITGLYNDDLNGSKVIYAMGGGENETDWIVLIGIQEAEHTQESATVSIQRKVPDMDFVCEAQNRLWGCRYGNDGTQNVNEIYCCALGDFRNWEQYLGISTDSWRGSCGTDGEWTGCINYLGAPTFFKENVIHTVTISSSGAHRIDDMPARGVQKGSHGSLAIVNETLFYKTRSGVAAYQGGLPSDISEALGDKRYHDAVAGVIGQMYYISMKEGNKWHFFCYNAQRGVWMHEDNLHAEGFASWGDELYVISDNKILAINGTEGTLEKTMAWEAISGIMYYEYTDQKYVRRYDIRLKMDVGAHMEVFLEYDSSGTWISAGTVNASTLLSATLPVRPRRCDHMRIKLQGTGNVRVLSIARILVKGSDMS